MTLVCANEHSSVGVGDRPSGPQVIDSLSLFATMTLEWNDVNVDKTIYK